jgi:hypothetical protein
MKLFSVTKGAKACRQEDREAWPHVLHQLSDDEVNNQQSSIGVQSSSCGLNGNMHQTEDDSIYVGFKACVVTEMTESFKPTEYFGG